MIEINEALLKQAKKQHKGYTLGVTICMVATIVMLFINTSISIIFLLLTTLCLSSINMINTNRVMIEKDIEAERLNKYLEK